MEPNYFVCTLGQAALPEIVCPYHDVNDLIEKQASTHPEQPAVGFYIPNKDKDTYEHRVLTFVDVRNVVALVANTITEKLELAPGVTVGLLCNSSPAFLFTWLALIRLGHPVLLIAPQCSASAVAHLSKACASPILFRDEAHEKLASEAVAASDQVEFPNMKAQALPFEHDDEVFALIGKSIKTNSEYPQVSETAVAYLHHTSGTSTGIPKPIPQTHRGGVGVLPALDGSKTATFTTTPLYHGGVADLFRAWASSALIWLFPSQHVPITATNVVRCLNASKSYSNSADLPPVKYFSSVPYVLQMMAQDQEGLKHLQAMNIVGVGGAALPSQVGDDLVCNNVNLVSRYGSAECGFLMSSHRNYSEDNEWQYLRQPDGVRELKFEKQEDEQSELVILSGWPHMAKTNREDGSFATSDLFAPHPTIPKAWKYHSRADSQLTLITGKKFDPSPLEGSLSASSPLLSEVLIFGNGKPYPGALIFRSEEGQNESDSNLVQQIAPIVEELNSDSQSHARIPRNMLIPMPYEPIPLDKSSKGTILRGQAEAKFDEQIEAAYNRTTFAHAEVGDEDVPDAICKIVEAVVGISQHDEPLSKDTDLFAYGVDSVACVQIRHALTQLLPKDADSLPLTIVEDSGNIDRLSETVLRRRRGEQAEDKDDNTELMTNFIEQYSKFETSSSPIVSPDKSSGYTVLLTGPTGLLGAHILSQLLSNPQIKKIILLVRGATNHAAKERVLKSLSSRQLPVPFDFDPKVQVLPCKLSSPDLGLSPADHETLTNETDIILHLAWAVNFLISLRSLGTTHLAGLQNLLNLAITSPRRPRFVFCSSVASVSSLLHHRQIPESIVNDISACGSTGYAQSKLAAELICSRCAASPDSNMRGRITVIRVGQLSGDTKHGVWNATEAYPLMLASSKATGVLPDLHDEALAWLPVDVAAKCYIEAALRDETSATTSSNADTAPAERGVKVLHLLNTNTTTTFVDLTTHLKSITQLNTIPATSWLEKLEALQADPKTKDHPSLKLLSFWKTIYGSKNRNGNSEGDVRGYEGGDEYAMMQSLAYMPTLRSGIAPLEKEYLLKLWDWIRENV